MKKHIIPSIFIAFAIVIGFELCYADQSTEAFAEVNVGLTETEPINFEERYAYWLNHGYSNIYEYKEALENMQNDTVGLADEMISKYSIVITDEQKEQLYFYEDKMVKASCIPTFEKYEELFAEIVDDCQAKMPKKVYKPSSSSSYSAPAGEGVLTRSGGMNSYNGRTETWYSQRVLPGGGLDIPGRHVAEDGTIRDENEYIVVAASDLPYGTTVDTSLGEGKVYDTGAPSGTTDIYTDW